MQKLLYNKDISVTGSNVATAAAFRYIQWIAVVADRCKSMALLGFDSYGSLRPIKV